MYGDPNAAYNPNAYNPGGYNQGGYNQGGYNQGAHNQGAYNQGYGGQNHNSYSPYPGISNPGGNTNSYSPIQNATYRRDDMLTRNNENLYKDNEGNLDQDLYDQGRNGFIKKVYTLLSIQLIITALIAVWASLSPSFGKIFNNTPMLIIVSVGLMAMSFVFCCCIDFVRKYGLPILIVFTLLEAILVGIICSMTKTSIVLMAAGITAVIVIGLTAYACFTKSDFTGCGPYLFIISLVIFIFGIVLIFWRNPIAHLVYSCLAGLLFCVYLVFDTQLILGKGQYSYTLDDAYLAAIQLYVDIIQIFLQLLNILGAAD